MIGNRGKYPDKALTRVVLTDLNHEIEDAVQHKRDPTYEDQLWWAWLDTRMLSFWEDDSQHEKVEHTDQTEKSI
jgi:hypothetical protein